MKVLLNIWMQPVYARLNLHGIRALVVLALTVPVLSQVLVFALESFNGSSFSFKVYGLVLLISSGGILAILFYAWFIMLVMNVGLQYSPANARFLPGLKRYMQAALLLPIVFAGVVATLGFGLISNKWGCLPFFAVSLFFSFFALTVRSQWAVVPFVLMFQLPSYFTSNSGHNPVLLIQSYTGLSADWQYFVGAILVLVISQTWLFSVGDDAHFKMHQQALKVRSGFMGQRAQDGAFALSFAIIYFQVMRREIQNVFKRNTNHLSLVKFAFGPKTHWSTLLLQTLAMSAAAVLFLYLVSLISNKKADFWEGFGLGFGASLLCMILFMQPFIFLIQVFYAIYQTRAEQSLVCLAPLAGPRSLVDKTFSNFLYRQFAVFYGLSCVAVFVMALQFAAFDWKAAALILGLACLFPLIVAIPADHAKMKTIHDHPLMKLIVISLVTFVAFGASFFFVPLIWVFAYAVVIVAMTSIFLVRSHRARARGPIFPVGCAV
ncbi:hypothetical protein H8K35_11815 [Undibacterium sp. LX40W]|uniref:Uncharacterized protein n=1 Tax=Undibacterium nitidum TaxID=2762298 RepID=A0A923HXK9_9BURK|nr:MULTISPECIES: hypothetical protein [Undibacterium]MBC3882071.1 hypothetical protein [Undibacterium nitidum]MBC3892352.1 hypothetical protein [Undibacterium sp. LX40W]